MTLLLLRIAAIHEAQNRPHLYILFDISINLFHAEIVARFKKNSPQIFYRLCIDTDLASCIASTLNT